MTTMETSVARSGEEELRACTDLLCSFAESRDPAQFEQLARRAEAHLQRRASFELARVGRIADESEVVQESLLNIYRYAHTFRPTVPHAFATWSTRIVRNVVLRFLRRRKRFPSLSLEDLGGASECVGPELVDPHRRLEEKEERTALQRDFSLWLRCYLAAFFELTELQQQVLHCVEIDGLRYREVGERFGMRADAVKMVVFRGRRRMLQLMERAVRAA
jgi:RNA polymerase sigma factor (sigma-70 family)